MTPAIVAGVVIAVLLGAGVMLRQRPSNDALRTIGRRLGLTEEDDPLHPGETVLQGRLAQVQTTVRREGPDEIRLSVAISPPLGPGMQLSWRDELVRLDWLGRLPEVAIDSPSEVVVHAVDPAGAKALLSLAATDFERRVAGIDGLRVTDDVVVVVLRGAPDADRLLAAARRAGELSEALREAARASGVRPWRETLLMHWQSAGVSIDAALTGRHGDRAYRVVLDEERLLSVGLKMQMQGRAPPPEWELVPSGSLARAMRVLGPRDIELEVPIAAPMVAIVPERGPRPSLSAGLLDTLAPVPPGLLRVRGEGSSELALTISMDAAREQLPTWLALAAQLAVVLAVPDSDAR